MRRRTAEGGRQLRGGSFNVVCVRRFLIQPVSCLYINQTGDEPQKQDTQANKRTPLLREEVPNQIMDRNLTM